MTGDHLGVGHGTGFELDRIRPYEPGDDVRRIDWNATARTLVPQVREDVPDRQLTAWLLLDHSPSMHFGTADRRKADVAEGAALVVGRFAARRGNRLGIVSFGAGHETVTPPAGGEQGDARAAPGDRHRAARRGQRRDEPGPRPVAGRCHALHPGRRRHRLGLPRPARLGPRPDDGRRPPRGHRPRGHRPTRGRARRRRRADAHRRGDGSDPPRRHLRSTAALGIRCRRRGRPHLARCRVPAALHPSPSTVHRWALAPDIGRGFTRTPDRTGRSA